jgi:biopolymer transport protein ExbD
MPLKRRKDVKPEFSLAAMIDVLFLLLMFFMLTSNLVSTNALNLKLPSSGGKSIASSSLSISIKKDGSLYLGQDRITEAKLEGALSKKVKSIGDDPKKTTITIAAESGCSIDDVVLVMDIVRKLELSAILATNPK